MDSRLNALDSLLFPRDSSLFLLRTQIRSDIYITNSSFYSSKSSKLYHLAWISSLLRFIMLIWTLEKTSSTIFLIGREIDLSTKPIHPESSYKTSESLFWKAEWVWQSTFSLFNFKTGSSGSILRA